MDAIALITVVIACISALAACWAVKTAMDTHDASYLDECMRSYGSERMFQALQLLVLYRQAFPDTFPKQFLVELKSGEGKGTEVNDARRIVKWYFLRTWRKYKLGYLKKELLIELCNVDGFQILFEIIQPLEEALNPKYDRRLFDDLSDVMEGVDRLNDWL